MARLALASTTLRSLVIALVLAISGAGLVSLVHAASPEKASFRLRLCSQAPVPSPGPSRRPAVARLRGDVHAGAVRSRHRPFGGGQTGQAPVSRVRPRRPDQQSRRPSCSCFPGYSASAEGAAFYYTQTRFERLADRDGFIVVYGNGLPNAPSAGEKACDARGWLSSRLPRGARRRRRRRRVRSPNRRTARDGAEDQSLAHLCDGALRGRRHGVRARARGPGPRRRHRPRGGLPFQPRGWVLSCHPKPGHERVSIAMLGATHDRFISYTPGGSPEYPAARAIPAWSRRAMPGWPR